MGGKDKVLEAISYFNQGYSCLLISYESLRNHIGRIKKCDLIIFDEGHRLKNKNIKTVQILHKFHCKRRIIVSGTPLQNSMDEFYCCIDFVNPGFFPSFKMFKKIYAEPIMSVISNNATGKDFEVAKIRSKELSSLISQFMIRRTSKILEKILPQKKILYIFLRFTELQEQVYRKIIH